MTQTTPPEPPELYVDEIGAARDRPVLLLHGGGVAGWMWRPLIEHLRAGSRFLVPDLPGHDHSAREPYRSHDHTVAALTRLLEQRADRPATVVGFSLGAQLAVLLASRRSDLVARTAVISAQAVPSRWPAATLALLGLAAPLAKNERFARAQAKELFVPEALFPDYLRTSRSLSRRSLIASVGENIRFRVPAGWGSFPGEALVMVGARERAMMRSSARSLAEAHDGAEPDVIAECGHGAPLQRPEWLARRLEHWLQ